MSAGNDCMSSAVSSAAAAGAAPLLRAENLFCERDERILFSGLAFSLHGGELMQGLHVEQPPHRPGDRTSDRNCGRVVGDVVHEVPGRKGRRLRGAIDVHQARGFVKIPLLSGEVALVAATLWRRYVGRGPLEALIAAAVRPLRRTRT